MNPTQTAYMLQELVDKPVRGFVELPSGEIGVVFDGGRMLVVNGRARLLSTHMSLAAIRERSRALISHTTTLAAAYNLHGPSAGERITARREDAVTRRDRGEVRRSIDLTDAEEPDFVSGYDSVGTISTADAERRTEKLRREVPNV